MSNRKDDGRWEGGELKHLGDGVCGRGEDDLAASTAGASEPGFASRLITPRSRERGGGSRHRKAERASG
eukprot:1219288-Rhodomonas_salina.2